MKLAPAPKARLTGTVFAGVAFGSTALFAAHTVAPLVVKELRGSAALSGVPGASAVFGTAFASAMLSNVMARAGRRRGLALGWGIGVAGALLAAIAAREESIALLIVGMALVGMGHSSNQLSRFAAADVHAPERRAFVLGWVVWASTFGAAVGPLLLGTVEPIAADLGFPPLAGGFLMAIVFYSAAFGVSMGLRPDPSSFAHDEDVAADDVPLREYFRMPMVRLAVGALLAAQTAMILVMSMTPVHLKGMGHDLGAVGAVMSAHVIGMFAFAPVMGKLVERIGVAVAMLSGVAVLLVATLSAAAAPSSGAMLGVSLFLLGLGWSVAFVSGSSLLTQGLSYAQRARVQGRVDAGVWAISACASLAAGVALDIVGYAWLCVGASVVALLPARAALRARTAAA